VTTEVKGHLRTNATDYAAAWAPYVKAVSEAVKGYQVNEGGPVVAIQIENEYPQPEDTGKVQKLVVRLSFTFSNYRQSWKSRNDGRLTGRRTQARCSCANDVQRCVSANQIVQFTVSLNLCEVG
jgi:hypothetical protein